MKIITDKISLKELVEAGEGLFDDMVKAVVDVDNEIIAIGGGLHSDEELILLENGSRQEYLWGINIYYNLSHDDRVEFDSLINIRPAQNNRSRFIEDEALRNNIIEIVNKLVE